MTISGTGITAVSFFLFVLMHFIGEDAISACVYLCLYSVSLHSGFFYLFSVYYSSVLICCKCSFTGMLHFLFRMKPRNKHVSCLVMLQYSTYFVPVIASLV